MIQKKNPWFALSTCSCCHGNYSREDNSIPVSFCLIAQDELQLKCPLTITQIEILHYPV